MVKSILVIAIGFIAVAAITGCRTTRAGADLLVIEHQRQIDRLEEELRNRDRAIDNAVRELGAVTARSASMEGAIDDIIGLFGEYQRRVEQLIYDYNKVRTETEDD